MRLALTTYAGGAASSVPESKNSFQTRAATIAPKIGAIRKSQTWPIASPLTKIAGPKLLAGLTEVPVMGMPTRWMNVRDNPIEMPANPLGDALLVEPNITKRNRPVRIASARKHAPREYPAGDPAP